MRQSAVTRALSRHPLPALVIVLVAVLTGLGVGVLLGERGSVALAPSDEPLPSVMESADPSETASPSSENGSSPSASTVPTAAATPTSTAPTMPMPTDAPRASPSVAAGFQYQDILRVEVNGLAVREAPSRTSPLAQGYEAVGGTVQPLGDVRLDAGYFVSVHLGPLRNGDTVWYLVWPAADAVLNYNPGPWWDSNGGSPR